MLIAPLLLLSTPGSRLVSVTDRAGSAVVTSRAVATSAPLPVTAAAGLHWPLVIAIKADLHTVVVAGTTTTTSPPPTIPAPAVAHMATTTTTWDPPTTTTTSPPPTTTTTQPPAPVNRETGTATWYQAADGTCASPDIAFGTVVTVTDLDTGQSTKCTVDDREPQGSSTIDLSEGTFSQLADPSQGVFPVQVTW